MLTSTSVSITTIEFVTRRSGPGLISKMTGANFVNGCAYDGDFLVVHVELGGQLSQSKLIDQKSRRKRLGGVVATSRFLTQPLFRVGGNFNC